MRVTVALALSLTLLSSAFAFDGAKSVDAYYKLRPECRLGETVAGQTLTADQSAASCANLDKVGKELTKNGYCWKDSEQEWATCQ